MTEDGRRYVVIGGGLAGLASAVWLAEAGKQVTLLERRGRLGGRTYAMRAEGVDDLPDNGQHVIASGYEHLFRYLTSVGTRQFVTFPRSSTLRWPDGRQVTVQTAGLGAVRTLFGVHPDAGIADRLRAARATLRLGWQALRPPADLADLSTEQWLQRVGMPPLAREAVWDWLALGIAAEPVAQGSAKVFAKVLATGIRMGIRHRTPVAIGYPTVDLDTLFVSGALRFFVDHDVDVRYRAVARRIQITDGVVTGVLLADGTEIPADAVVCAVPNSAIGGLLDDLPEGDEIRSAADKLGYTPIVSTNLYLDRPLGTASAFEGLIGGTGVIDEVFDRQIMHGRTTDLGWLYCLTTSGAYEQIHRTNDEIVAEQMALLRRYYPAAADAEVVEAQVVKMPKATFSQVVGMDSLRPPQRTSVPTLVLAGDWTATDWSATMESAAQSAATAVDLLLS
ncbi:phytoene desaturase [Mycobacterium antarcticum]|uniref:hydroxysqualene dehydroxylase HpnE n=1 Tax=unclassified Mycolicibacterium TaxID=2636767 RepID=UPI00238DB1E2|nr:MULTISPECIES: hydroxysqualene dehydroxylase HpnE [unclassified Mycolicibacterium]BDX29860.1 phytoene desaturase [Mycolicibacterium sp. TUM20985]GLP78996.1 phytoene desaturase [Mycolicibacterium sp. TUM20984]